jgi:hypothetical protein
MYTASKYLLEASKLLVDHEKVVSKLLLDLAKTLLDETFEVLDQNLTQDSLIFKSETPNITTTLESRTQESKAIINGQEVLCNGHTNVSTKSTNQSCKTDNKNSSCGINQNKVSDFMTRDIDTPEVTEIFEKIKAKLNKSKEEL